MIVVDIPWTVAAALAFIVQDAPEMVASWLAVTLIDAPLMATDVEPLTVTLGAVSVALWVPVAVRVEPERESPCVAPMLTVWLPVMVIAFDEVMLKTPVEARVVPLEEDVLICWAFKANVLHAMVMLSEF